MKVVVVGGGPAGLYFSYLLKREKPNYEVRLIEQNEAGATFGFGVVFSHQALESFKTNDEPTYSHLIPHMESWPNLEIVHRDERVPIDGNGFAAIGRLHFLKLLQWQCIDAGVQLLFESKIHSTEELPDADLIVAADGANSTLRRLHIDEFQTSETKLNNPFIWFGTTRVFDSLSLTFRSNDHGVFCGHHYRYCPNMSTFIVETNAATFENAGFACMDNQQIRTYCEAVFAADLEGHPLLSNQSIWRWFPQIRNHRWSHGNIVLIGDALHTAHFSIGSGTRLALEDAFALVNAMLVHPGDLPAILDRFKQRRRPALRKLVDASIASARWYERMDELVRNLDPYELARSYMGRTGRISQQKLSKIAPRFVRICSKTVDN